jgi:hypothetical protein
VSEDTRARFEKSLEALLIATVELAFIRHDLRSEECFTSGEDMTESAIKEIAQDAAWAVQGEGTCAETPIEEWKTVLAAKADTHLERPAPQIDKVVADLRSHYDSDWDTTVPGAEFNAEIKRILATYAESIRRERRPICNIHRLLLTAKCPACQLEKFLNYPDDEP